MATLSRGLTFAADGTVTATALHSLIDDGSVSDIARGDMASASKIVTVASSEPSSMATGELWFDTTGGQDKLKVKAAYATSPVGVGKEVVLTNNSGGALSRGSVVIVDSSQAESVTTTTTEQDPLVLGVIGDDSDVADAAEARIVSGGLARVRTTGTIAIGDYLYASTTAGVAASSSTSSSGQFAIALEADADTLNYVNAILTGQPAVGVPANAIILRDQSSSCPAGYTVDNNYSDRFLKAVGSSSTSADPSSNPNGIAPASSTRGSIDMEGINVYDGGQMTYSVQETGDSAVNNQSANPLSDLGHTVDTTAEFGAIGTTNDLVLVNGSDSTGDHVHRLSNLTNQPAYRKVIICRKD